MSEILQWRSAMSTKLLSAIILRRVGVQEGLADELAVAVFPNEDLGEMVGRNLLA